MNGFSFLLLMFAAFFGYRALLRYADTSETRRYGTEEIERLERIVERDPSNSGTRAQLAEEMVKAGDLEGGIHQFRTAIGNSPHGPFTESWKRKLKHALEEQEMLKRDGKIAGFNEWRTCRKCQAKHSFDARTCPKCGEVLQMETLEWLQSGNVAREIWRESWPITLALCIAATVVSSLPMEWQATIIIASLLVGFWLFLRSFNV